MRVISKFSDYFDSVMSEGQDMSLVYRRVMMEVEADALKNPHPAIKPLAAFLDRDGGMPNGYTFEDSTDRVFKTLSINFGLILFAGRLYPYAQTYRTRIGAVVPDGAVHIFNLDELTAYMAEYGVTFKSKQRGRRSWNFNTPMTLDAFFALDASEKLHAHATAHHIASALIANGHYSPIIINPKLADKEFYRRLGPYEAYQEMSMFLGNLAHPEKMTSKVDDKYKILGHGFDLKESFRKRAGA